MSADRQEPAISVKLAKTDELKYEAYRLRYSAFAVEMGDHRYADHSKQTWSDPDDLAASYLFVAINNQNQVIGTMRLTAYRMHKFIAADQYHFGELAMMLNMPIDGLLQRVARADRGVVDRNARGTSVLANLQAHVEAFAQNLGIDILVGVTEVCNDRARNAYRKLGWKDTDLLGEHKGFKCNILYKIIGNTEAA